MNDRYKVLVEIVVDADGLVEAEHMALDGDWITQEAVKVELA